MGDPGVWAVGRFGVCGCSAAHVLRFMPRDSPREAVRFGGELHSLYQAHFKHGRPVLVFVDDILAKVCYMVQAAPQHY